MDEMLDPHRISSKIIHGTSMLTTHNCLEKIVIESMVLNQNGLFFSLLFLIIADTKWFPMSYMSLFNWKAKIWVLSIQQCYLNTMEIFPFRFQLLMNTKPNQENLNCALASQNCQKILMWSCHRLVIRALHCDRHKVRCFKNKKKS